MHWGGGPLSAFQRVTFAELAEVRAAGHRPLVLDVRRDEERRTGAIAGSCSIPLHEVQGRLGELPADRTVWVHCAAGYRASIAAGLLEAAGRHVLLIDDVMPSGPPKAVRAGTTDALSAAGAR